MLQGFLEAIKEFSFTQGLILDIADMEDITDNNNKNDNDKLLPLLGFTLEKAIRLGLEQFFSFVTDNYLRKNYLFKVNDRNSRKRCEYVES